MGSSVKHTAPFSQFGGNPSGSFWCNLTNNQEMDRGEHMTLWKPLVLNIEMSVLVFVLHVMIGILWFRKRLFFHQLDLFD